MGRWLMNLGLLTLGVALLGVVYAILDSSPPLCVGIPMIILLLPVLFGVRASIERDDPE